jgi:serine/threonine-protein kinase RsbW
VPLARKVLRHALTVLEVVPGCIDDIELAISEACTNVLDHAGQHDEYTLVAGIDGDYCLMEVCDEGAGFDVPPESAQRTPAEPLAEGGRGIQVMRALVDQLDFAIRDDHGSAVRLRKRLVYVRSPSLASAHGDGWPR